MMHSIWPGIHLSERTEKGSLEGRKFECLHTNAAQKDLEGGKIKVGDVLEDSKLELGRGGFKFNIFEKDASGEADAKATGGGVTGNRAQTRE